MPGIIATVNGQKSGTGSGKESLRHIRMARIRSIKPNFFVHEGLFEAERDTGLPLRISYIGLWTLADREGRFEWRPRQLKLGTVPYDDVDFSRVLDALATRGFIVRYEVDGESYGYIPSWQRHQVINNRESASQLPPPPRNQQVEVNQSVDAQGTGVAREDDARGTRLVHAQGDGDGDGDGDGEGKGRVYTPPTPSKSLNDASEVKTNPNPGVNSISASPLQPKTKKHVPDNSTGYADLLVRQWQEAGMKRNGVLGVIEAAKEALEHHVERCDVTLLQAFTDMKAGQEQYFQSVLFKSGNGWFPKVWFREGHYLDHPDEWKTADRFGRPEAEKPAVDPCTVKRSGHYVEELEWMVDDGRFKRAYEQGKRLSQPWPKLTDEEVAKRGSFIAEVQRTWWGSTIFTDEEWHQAIAERKRLYREGKLKSS